VLVLLFLTVGSYLYYNISYLNEWLSKGEQQERSITYEKKLKRYQRLPLPTVLRITEAIDLYPEEKREVTDAWVTIQNQHDQPIAEMLLDADGLTDYSILSRGRAVKYSSPLLYSRGMFSWFRPAADTSDFRLYRFDKPLAPGDSMLLEVRSEVTHKGFENGLYDARLLNNGILFNTGLPGLGYDEDDELDKPYIRMKAGLPPKVDEEIAQNDPAGYNALKGVKAASLYQMDATVSVPGDETAVCPGELMGQWTTADGRNHFRYRLDQPGMYPPFAVMAARYADLRDSVMVGDGGAARDPVGIDIYYNPEQGVNLDRYMRAYKDGLRYFSAAYGNYPFHQIRQVQLSDYGPREGTLPTMTVYAESNGWNAHFTGPDQFDYLYKNTLVHVAQQWWRYQVAPNNTVGSMVISEGLAGYNSLVMLEKRYGKVNMLPYTQDQIWVYNLIHQRLSVPEHPVLTANFWFEWANKAGLVLYGLHDLIGEDRMNAALREFRASFAFRSDGPYAGSNDLYAILKKHVPDSMQYYLTDTWEKLTFYDNKVVSVSSLRAGRPNEYKVTIRVDVAKNYKDAQRNDVPAVGMNDYIDIGVLAADSLGADGRPEKRFLYLQKYRLTQGVHEITVVVRGEPKAVGIDPLGMLIDRNRGDNIKKIE